MGVGGEPPVPDAGIRQRAEALLAELRDLQPYFMTTNRTTLQGQPIAADYRLLFERTCRVLKDAETELDRTAHDVEVWQALALTRHEQANAAAEALAQAQEESENRGYALRAAYADKAKAEADVARLTAALQQAEEARDVAVGIAAGLL